MDSRVPLYVGEKVGTVFCPPLVALGVEENGVIIGGVVLNCFTGNDIEMSIAGETRTWSRPFIQRVRDYIFDELGCERVSITTKNQKVIELAYRLGAQTEGRKRNHFGKGEDAVILGILRDEWTV